MVEAIFPLSLALLKFAGFKPPPSFNLPFLLCYKFYSVVTFSIVLFLILFLLLYSVVDNESPIESLTENLYLLISFSNCISKSLYIFFRRNRIDRLLEKILDDQWTALRDDEESEIIKKSEFKERFIVQSCAALLIGNGLTNVAKPILPGNADNKLVVEAYEFCDRSQRNCFWFLYIYQCLAFTIVSMIHLGYDCLLYNFIDRLCALLKIVECRITKLPEFVKRVNCAGKAAVDYEKCYLTQCVQQHKCVLELIDEFNGTFYESVTIQLFSSILVMCTNIYLLAALQLFSPQFYAVFIYFCCVLTQNFLFCWYGYKLTVQNREFFKGITNMDWYVLQMDTKKMLFYIMLYSSNELKVFVTVAITLSPESFVKLLKLSYSAFTVLQRSNKNVEM